MINNIDLNPQIHNFNKIKSGNKTKLKTENSSEVDKVTEIKEKIQKGEYQLDMLSTAQKLVQEIF
jgi:anti-sigma28 factor (negative regulator of flagellin synthesis)